MPGGRCHCGAVSYEADGEAAHHALCLCEDCRRSAGAPMVGWIAYREEQVSVRGEPVTYRSSEQGERQFCGTCGTGLFYRNAAMLPGIVDIQSSTLDEAGEYAPDAQIQVADQLAWVPGIGALPKFDRYPG